tara:strand:- start:6650 stop:6874 length:225 start_codon:yes stop_codon:yes gene_type:complete
MSAEDLRAKSVDELVKIIIDLRKEQFNARFQQAQGSFENTAQIRKNRREIARAKTILNQKRQEEAQKPSGKKAA